MKSKELIRLLQEVDPSGEIECCIGNADILAVGIEPAYYDGPLQVLIRDPNLSHCYDVVGAKRTENGQKLVIESHSIAQAIENNPDLPIDYSEIHESGRKAYQDADERERQENREIQVAIEREYFGKHLRLRAASIDSEPIPDEQIDEFFSAHLSPDDPLPSHLGEAFPWPSYIDDRNADWSRRVDLRKVEGRWELEMKDATA